MAQESTWGSCAAVAPLRNALGAAPHRIPTTEGPSRAHELIRKDIKRVELRDSTACSCRSLSFIIFAPQKLLNSFLSRTERYKRGKVPKNSSYGLTLPTFEDQRSCWTGTPAGKMKDNGVFTDCIIMQPSDNAIQQQTRLFGVEGDHSYLCSICFTLCTALNRSACPVQ